MSRPLYGGCPLFGGSVIRGFTVVDNVWLYTVVLDFCRVLKRVGIEQPEGTQTQKQLAARLAVWS